MAIELSGFKISAIAGENLSNMQYHWVKISANNTVLMATELTDMPCGILQNNPVEGLAAEIMVIGISKLQLHAGAIAFGVLVGTDGDGHGITVDPDGANDYYYCGQIIMGAGANEIASALINCAAPVIQSGS